ncbi:hypothetical protein AA13594_0608 [Gluconacetobacter azotocaptans DSM 13594]|nr:hypothetical protein AA13594_0608 [Gluconacetobacter azotocaptans DSM 13594]
MCNLFGRRFGEIDEFVSTEITQQQFMLARRHGDDARTLHLRDLHREVPYAASGAVHEDGRALERHWLMRVRLKGAPQN